MNCCSFGYDLPKEIMYDHIIRTKNMDKTCLFTLVTQSSENIRKQLKMGKFFVVVVLGGFFCLFALSALFKLGNSFTELYKLYQKIYVMDYINTSLASTISL